MRLENARSGATATIAEQQYRCYLVVGCSLVHKQIASYPIVAHLVYLKRNNPTVYSIEKTRR